MVKDLIDYHIHTALCGHAAGEMADYAAAAARKGLREIGFADHFPLRLLGFDPLAKVTMEAEELDCYVEAVRRLARSQQQLVVKLGIEVDYLPGKEEELRDILSRYPFDYVIGSIHFIDGWDFTHPAQTAGYKTRDLGALYCRYFDLVAEACRSGLFDIIGHVDVIKKFGFFPEEDLEPYWQKTAAVLKETGICLELNTAGKEAPAGEFYPRRRLLELCSEQGVAVTLGSDAHAPEQVGRFFPEARALLRDAGYREVALFSGRRRSTVPLP